MSNKGTFQERTSYLVREHVGITTYLNEFAAFDPEAKPTVAAFTQSLGALVVQLKDRGVEPVGSPMPHLPLEKNSAVRWAERFAAIQQTSCVDYCKTVDRALVPFMAAYEAAWDGLKAYLKNRVEV